MRSLIINADDFGFDTETCNTTVDCFEAGLLTSATIMVGCEASQQAYEYARANARRFSFGLHFNIVDGFAPAAEECPKSLCDETGSFRESDDQRMAAMLGKLTVADIRREFRVQLEELRDNHVQVTHIDSHGHLHKFPTIIYSLRSEMRRAGVSWVRRPQNVFLRPNGKRRVINNVFSIPFWGLMRTDYYCAVDSGDEMWAKRLPEMVPEGLTEVSVHPGRKESWRFNEARPLLAPEEFRKALTAAGIELTRYGAEG
ncbi:ChbG/HpnK family deacetylase [Cupriavidus agavae]|uniref:ChbG/HpnK family deacetylase n=1 Tax=Cupriavidus agavae TaxID=1001822 RepID=A0A4Q7S6G7_9BURK|nr:ChbG/HpnK family deacetylase [Cupriavidus agavae]RZT41260.1 hypothetical protein EV147_0246 [Cupriavidus agavae]